MDFMNRNAQQPARSASANGPSGSTSVGNGNASAGVKGKKFDRQFGDGGKWFRVSAIILLFSITILIAALSGIIAFGGNGAEGKFVEKDKYQAVFINVTAANGGQVYFGHITDFNSQFIRLQNVFYLQDQQNTAKNGAHTLVKLGCELHGPEDAMVINRDQVYFWENLKDSGQLVQKIKQYYKENGNDMKCANAQQNSSSQQSSSSTNAQNSSSAGTGTNNNSTNNSTSTDNSATNTGATGDKKQ